MIAQLARGQNIMDRHEEVLCDIIDVNICVNTKLSCLALSLAGTVLCTFYFDVVTAVCQLLINEYVMLCSQCYKDDVERQWKSLKFDLRPPSENA